MSFLLKHEVDDVRITDSIVYVRSADEKIEILPAVRTSAGDVIPLEDLKLKEYGVELVDMLHMSSEEG